MNNIEKNMFEELAKNETLWGKPLRLKDLNSLIASQFNGKTIYQPDNSFVEVPSQTPNSRCEEKIYLNDSKEILCIWFRENDKRSFGHYLFVDPSKHISKYDIIIENAIKEINKKGNQLVRIPKYPIKDLNLSDPYLMFHSANNSIEKYLKSFPHIDNVREIFAKIFTDEMVPICNVFFVNKKTMGYNTSKAERKIVELAKKGLDIIQKIIFDDNDVLLSALKKDFESIISNSDNVKEIIVRREIIYKWIPTIILGIEKRICYSKDKTEISLLKKLIDIMYEIADIYITQLSDENGSTLGNYSGNEIRICIENIEDTVKDFNKENNANLSVEDLAESVLVHEYAHHVHISLAGQNKKPDLRVRAVQETVAETIQYLFAHSIGSNDLVSYLEKLVEGKKFPIDVYAGEWELRDWAEEDGQPNTLDYELDLVKYIIFDSINDGYNDAFECLMNRP